jgi:hypothetical protein
VDVPSGKGMVTDWEVEVKIGILLAGDVVVTGMVDIGEFTEKRVALSR